MREKNQNMCYELSFLHFKHFPTGSTFCLSRYAVVGLNTYDREGLPKHAWHLQRTSNRLSNTVEFSHFATASCVSTRHAVRYAITIDYSVKGCQYIDTISYKFVVRSIHLLLLLPFTGMSSAIHEDNLPRIHRWMVLLPVLIRKHSEMHVSSGYVLPLFAWHFLLGTSLP